MRKALFIALLAFGCGEAETGALSPAPEPRFDFGCPNEATLACTGLYGPEGEHWYSKQPGDGVEPYTPGAALWSDHMEKQRFIWLPPGTVIDTTDADGWRFPIGTKFWKEFAYQGKRVETRYLERRAYSWYAATFRWTADEANAFLLREGERNVPGTFENRYEVPRTEDCKRCHGGAKDEILGFSAVLMADDNARGSTVQKLQERGKLSAPLPAMRIPGTPVERAALGYLHVNCGLSCHNPSFDAEAWWTGFYMKLTAGKLATVADTALFKTGVGVDSYIADPSGLRYLKLIAPGDPEHSAVVFRDGQRDSDMQMPPLATHTVDEAGVAAVKAWIASLPR
jgi:hypothetical protein